MNENQASPAPPSRRDELAIIRTDLANERTLLAYVRTSVMFAATAVSLVKFFPDTQHIHYASYGFGGVSALCVLAGVIRFVRLKRRIRFK